MGKNVLVSMLIMSMLLNVAVGFFDPVKTVANQAQKGVQDIAKQAFGRKTLEENEGKIVNDLHDALGIKGLQRGIEFADQKTPEENGGEQACDQGQGQNLAENIVFKNIFKQPAN